MRRIARLKVAVLAFLLSCTVAASGSETMDYCNAVQNRTGFIRYPLGTMGVWSTATGETADVITRAPRVYPCVTAPVARIEKDDWRASVTGDPSILTIRYREDKPAGSSTMAITVSPHVSVFKVTFPQDASAKNLVLDFRKVTVDTWARLHKWTERKITRVDDRTFQATLGEPGKRGAYYIVKLSAPCTSSEIIDSASARTGADTNAAVGGPCLYAQVNAPEVTVAVAGSFSGLEQAQSFVATEFTSFEQVHQRCHAAWKEFLGRVQLEGSEDTKRMAYTALYTMLVNIIDGSDGGYYAGACSRPLSVASSAYWQFVGGYQSCCWDNVRATYPFLALGYPDVMSDVINTYQARYQKDGCLDGDICLIAGPSNHKNVRFTPVLVAQAYYSGVKADYARLYAALKDNFHNEAIVSSSLRRLGRLTQGESGGFACSRSLEFHTGARAMASLAELEQDRSAVQPYLALSKSYTNLWDSTNQVFRLRNADGSWGPIENSKMTWNPNPQGLFEGTTRDWMFAVPHDPYGLLDLPGQKDFVRRLTDYCLNDAWFNDYQEIYPYMLYYADAANAGQRIIRDSWVPMFSQGVMYEGVRPKLPHNGWQTHYTGSSGWLLCSMLGLYPGAAPAGQYFISSPSVTKAVIHRGGNVITVETRNNENTNIYIRSIKVDDKLYPAYMIPAQRLAAGARIELEMGSDPAQGLGNLYVSSSDGFVMDAELLSATHLKCTILSPAGEVTTRIHSAAKPVRVMANGRASRLWTYDAQRRVLAIHSTGTTTIEVASR